MENFNVFGMQGQRGSQGLPGFNPNTSAFHPVTPQVANTELPQQMGVTMDQVQTEAFNPFLGPPTILDALGHYMQSVDANMQAVKSTTMQILGMMKVYDVILQRTSESTVQPFDVPLRKRRFHAEDFSQMDGKAHPTHVNVEDQSQQTFESIRTATTSLSLDKGKGASEDPNLNVIVPDSDDEDDHADGYEHLATPKICTSMTVTTAEAVTCSKRPSREVDNVSAMPQSLSATSHLYGRKSHDLSSEPYPQYSLIEKQLFMTPSPARRTAKRGRGRGSVRSACDGHQSTEPSPMMKSPRPRARSGKRGPKQLPKPPALQLPKHFNSHFRPTPEMGLSRPDCQFAADMDLSETIFVNGITRLCRGDFLSLCPGNQVDPMILQCMALKTTWSQKHGDMITTWSLPPSFSADAINGNSLDLLRGLYADKWMPPTTSLQLIYVPVHEDNTHWYLMVVNLKENNVYALDTFCPVEKMEARRRNMGIVSHVLTRILGDPPYTNGVGCEPPQISSWDIVDARGIPNRGNSEDSVVWVLGWLDMEYAFTSNLPGSINEPWIRITTATKLANSTFNHHMKFVETRAVAMWSSVVPNP